MNIYLYGSKRFKVQMTEMLEDANLLDITHEIVKIEMLESTLCEFPNDIYLIDNEKIISKNIITDKLNFLKAKDAIYKEYLEKIGIDDMCFNSNNALLNFIINKIDNEHNTSPVSFENNCDIKEIKEVNMNDITDINEIIEDDLLIALGEEIPVTTPTDILNDSLNTEENHDNNELMKEINDGLSLNSDNINDVVELIKRLSNNKTLELSIKLKDS